MCFSPHASTQVWSAEPASPVKGAESQHWAEHVKRALLAGLRTAFSTSFIIESTLSETS
eukprot:CAMPEP_0170139340 /NCGR_PEP_ID=MMETSP0033_2-20121228/5580_1 /TAXON_ID=195969 /ORGANISM="Dolichomastix tenuilepis, Strain CCMP3274" /LENGTH=58 /DNA_ID=CAMNT_0010375445 /DNA_START=288 /DNA_END=464 /DNA_ORIENTATION=+